VFEGTHPVEVEALLDRQRSEAYANEITEDEWVQDLLDAERRRQITPLSDAEAIAELIEVETVLAAQQARRARLVALLAQNRPATADRPTGHPGAATAPEEPAEVVPEILAVSEWLPHELQMAHPYSWTAVQDLVETSLVLTGRLTSTLDLLRAGRIDYVRARIMADLLGSCSEPVAHTVEAMVLPTAPGLTPGGLAAAVRRALARIDAAALRRRHARARRAADVGYYPTQDAMARLFADLPLPVAAACADAVTGYAKTQQAGGDDRPIGAIRTEVLTDLILRPWDTSRPPVTAEVTIHLSIPTRTDLDDASTSTGGVAGTGPVRRSGLDDNAAQADLDGHPITAAHCRELLAQLHNSRLLLALHDRNGGLQAMASHSQLRRAARRRRRRTRRNQETPTNLNRFGQECDGGPVDPELPDGLGLRPPATNHGYRPTADQDRYVRTRDRTCRHFGCTRKAVHADLDHHHPWPEGETAICNLCCYCRTHHRLKHQAPGWTRHFQDDATLTITTPTGITRTTRPPGPGSEPDLALPKIPAPVQPPAIDQEPTRTSDDDPPPF